MIKLSLLGQPFATRLTSNENVLEHAHDFYECLFVTEGSLTNVIDGKNEKMENGDMIIIPPDVPHSFLFHQKCIHRDVMITPKLFNEVCNFLEIDTADLFNEQQYAKLYIPTDMLKWMEQQLLTYTVNENVALRIKQERSIATDLLGLALFPKPDNKFTLNDFKTQCTSIVNEQFTSPNAIQAICDYFHYNQSYMCEKFKRIFGTTMTDYINELRIVRSAYLLSVSSYSLREICDLIGFNSLSYFNKLFKEKYNVSPAKYRKQGTENNRVIPIK